MSWIAVGFAFLLLLIGMPVGAEDFSVIVVRGSTLVRVSGDDDGEIREETLREDPTPNPPPDDTGAPVRRANEDSLPAGWVTLELAETHPPRVYFVVQPHGRLQPHARSHGMHGSVRRTGHPGHGRPTHSWSPGHRVEHGGHGFAHSGRVPISWTAVRR